MSSFKPTFYSYLPPPPPSQLSWWRRNVSPGNHQWFSLFMLPGSAFRASQTWWHLNGTHFGPSCCVEKAEKGGRRNMKQVGKGKVALTKGWETGAGVGIIAAPKQWLYWNDFTSGVRLLRKPWEFCEIWQACATKQSEQIGVGWAGRGSSELSSRKWAERRISCWMVISLICAAGRHAANDAVP